ncbi:hypothetical protein GUITHDRAFT_107656 [Guillardia theta CCMP2712]|uniref:Uncharacterized protein n=1 Tax=Guillardia theta (strain CCMP2712) TaxID=905079 RepID=L1JDS3_GUITC|nr:hypothetical protein GUITHDRAFT_107656 [Guillardia theta CCMP2712]EKX46452.1 hypothetical protein GUITHDRAFT_107656 [Guillardia theta CCMP2712]|eukprot:XP_005833432.1 hypothetical protein GUITHDRAFT_107656 [Guillardia theta CCMP2712]
MSEARKWHPGPGRYSEGPRAMLSETESPKIRASYDAPTLIPARSPEGLHRPVVRPPSRELKDSSFNFPLADRAAKDKINPFRISADRVALATPDLIRKTAVAANEFKRLQDVESQYKTAEGFWKGEIDHLKNQMFDIRNKHLDEESKLQREKAMLEAKVGEMDKEMMQLRKLREWEEERAKLMKTNEALRERCDKGSEQLQSHDARIHEIHTVELRARKAEDSVAALKEQLSFANNRAIEDSQAAESAAAERLAVEVNKVEKLSDELLSARKSYTSILESLSEKDDHIRSLKEEIRANTEESLRLHNMIRTLEDDKEYLDSQLSNTREALSQKEQTIDRLEDDLKQAREHAEKERAQGSEHLRRLKQMEEDSVWIARSHETAMAGLKDRLSQESESVQRMNTEILALKEALNSAKRQEELRTLQHNHYVEKIEALEKEKKQESEQHKKSMQEIRKELQDIKEETFILQGREDALKKEVLVLSNQLEKAWEEECSRAVKEERVSAAKCKELMRSALQDLQHMYDKAVGNTK